MKIFNKEGQLNVPEETSLRASAPRIASDPKHLIKQAFCQNGHPLIAEENLMFDGYPGIELYCETETEFDLVTLSPYLGDAKRRHDVEFQHKAPLRICCPTCMNELPSLGPHDCQEGAHFVALFLNERGNINDTVGICNIWSCHSAFLHAYGEILCRIRYDSVIPKC